MSSSGIGKIGANTPITPKEKISLKDRSEKVSKETASSVKDSVLISSDGAKVEEMFKNLEQVKTNLQENPKVAKEIHNLIPDAKLVEILSDKFADVQESLRGIMSEIKNKGEVASGIHLFDNENVAALLQGE